MRALCAALLPLLMAFTAGAMAAPDLPLLQQQVFVAERVFARSMAARKFDDFAAQGGASCRHVC